MTDPIRVLNLGAGVQSTAIYLMCEEGILPKIDYAIFADVQEEPQRVYDHLEWLKALHGAPILIGTAGKLGDFLVTQLGSGDSFVSIPAFTAPHHDSRQQLDGCRTGRMTRQCTRDYKIEVIERLIRRKILGLAPRKHIPRNVIVEQWFGISYEERGRAKRIAERFAGPRGCNGRMTCKFPLVERQVWREECQAFLAKRVPHEVKRSACVFCPLRRASEWLEMKQTDPAAWARAVEIDETLRAPGNVTHRSMNQAMYLHATALPLVQVDFEAEAAKEASRKTPDLFSLFDCGEGMCGV